MASRRPPTPPCPSANPERAASPRARGEAFENLAAAYLARHGLRELARNFNARGGEVDLVMRDGTVLVFVEVRYRRDRRFGGAAASIGARKRARLAHAAALFLARHPDCAHLRCRFDVVALEGDPARPVIEWISGAFSA